METGVGVLDKVMSILYLLGGNRESISVQEIVEELGYSSPTTYRLLNAMEKHGLIIHEGEFISLGDTLVALGMHRVGNVDIFKIAPRYMEELNRLTDENVNLNVRNHNQRIVVRAFQSTLIVRSSVKEGDMYPLFSGAAGKIFLAYYSKEEINRILNEADEYDVSATNKHVYEKYETSIDDFRTAGYSISINERKEGVVAIAAPIFNFSGHLEAVLTVVAPETRMDEEKQKIVIEQVKATAQNISKGLGYITKKAVCKS